MSSVVRVSVILVLFAACFLGIRSTGSVAAVPIKRPLAAFPERLDGWQLRQQRSLSRGVVRMLGVDDYIEYDYQSSRGAVANLYVSYFSAVGITGTYHSPRNCLPGSGWLISSVHAVSLPVPAGRKSRPLVVRSMLVRRGEEIHKVLYWFQSRGRVIASEYWEKIYLVWDALVRQRRDGAFVRIMYPVRKDDPGQDARMAVFAAKVAQTLKGYLPGERLD